MKDYTVQREEVLLGSALKRLKRSKRKALQKKTLRRLLVGISKSNKGNFLEDVKSVIIRLPESFVLGDGSAVKKINQLEKIFHTNKSVFVNMEKVKKIDYCGLAALLAVMFKFRKKGIHFNGNFPQDMNASQLVKKSGFLDKLFNDDVLKTIYNVNASNQFITQSDNLLFDLDLIDEKIIPEISDKIWGTKKRIPGLRITLLELIDNTRTHASGDESGERWWVSINHDSVNKKVTFVFLDYGIGVFTSLSKAKKGRRKNFYEKLQRTLGTEASDEHLKAIVEVGQQSVTGDPNRGQGIHGIKLCCDRNQISGLKILSNYAFGDVEKAMYRKLDDNFDGTLFYWEICYSTENLD